MCVLLRTCETTVLPHYPEGLSAGLVRGLMLGGLKGGEVGTFDLSAFLWTQCHSHSCNISRCGDSFSAQSCKPEGCKGIECQHTRNLLFYLPLNAKMIIRLLQIKIHQFACLFYIYRDLHFNSEYHTEGTVS